MNDALPLHNAVILLVEDDYYQARDASRALRTAGGEVEGPFAHSQKARVLDVNVADGTTFALAQALHECAVPFLFITAAGCERVRLKFDEVICLAKPLDYPSLVRSLVTIAGVPRHANS